MMVIMAGSQTIKQLLENITCHFQEDTRGKLRYQECQVLSSFQSYIFFMLWVGQILFFNFVHSQDDFI